MIKKLKGKDLYNEDIEYDFNIEMPHICPRCNQGSIFLYKSACVNKSIERHWEGIAYVWFLCPICEKTFIGEYMGEIDMVSPPMQEISIFPQTYDSNEKQFTQDIRELSPRFVEIYLQANKAEKMGLTQICGMGYRKALEVLVKEYAIYKNPDDEAVIIEYRLGKCIEAYFRENEKLYVLAKASSWLGNDETHYRKRHEHYGIDDMKSFIDILLSYIDSELKYDKAKSLIDNK